MAAYNGDLAQLKMLIETGVVSVNERDEKGSTPAHKGRFLCGLHKVCSHIMARLDLFNFYLSMRVDHLSRGEPQWFALRT